MPPAPDSIREAVRETVRLGRSQTQDPSSQQKGHTSGRRSQSQDSIPQAPQEKKSKGRSSKKGSQHADVIDRLDFTGVGPMFHHDGPFDACAPSRNRQKSRAPMMAWTPRLEDDLSGSNGPYPSPNAYNAFSDHYDPPKKKVDAIAEAWGIHEPEPFEEFFAGGGGREDTPNSSIYNGKDSHRTNGTRSKEPRRDNPARRSTVPPPQPIFVDGADAPLSPSAGTGALPKRNKSIMQRIRKMRDSPNVPVGQSYDEPTSPNGIDGNDGSNRPSHRHQNSLFGKKEGTGEPFVVIDARTNKDLPAAPGTGEHGDVDPDASNNGAAGLGRKTSLMKKVGKVVRGTR